MEKNTVLSNGTSSHCNGKNGDTSSQDSWSHLLTSARANVSPHVHMTPVMTSSTLDSMSGLRLFFKCENLQKTGAFKARGAINAVLNHLKVNTNAFFLHMSKDI